VGLGNRNDENAAHERSVAAHFADWLDRNQHDDVLRLGTGHEPDA
jgi:hypothetical protein